MCVCIRNLLICRSIKEDSPELDNIDDLEEDEEPLVIDQEQWQGLYNMYNCCIVG